MKKHCPACAIDVEYEGENHAYCSVCGRTQEVAERLLKSRRDDERNTKVKWILVALGVVAILALFLIRPERTLETAIAASVQGIGLVLIVWVVNKVRKSREQNERRKINSQDS